MTPIGAAVGASRHERSPWPTLALVGGIAALCAMLLLFQRVVQQQASDGERRRAATTALSVATANCNRMPRTAERAACRAALVPVPRTNASLSRSAPEQP